MKCATDRKEEGEGCRPKTNKPILCYRTNGHRPLLNRPRLYKTGLAKILTRYFQVHLVRHSISALAPTIARTSRPHYTIPCYNTLNIS